MIRLTSAVLALVLLFALMSALALGIGRSQPPSERVERLHLTDCGLPCWNDLTPRVSSLSEVQTRIAATFPNFKHLSSVNLPFQTWTVDDLAPNDTSIDIAVDDGLVYSINLQTRFVSDQMPRLGEVLAIFGVPTCVSRTDFSGDATFSYESGARQAILQVSVAQPSLYSPITALFVGAAKPFTCTDILAISWADFRSLQRSFS